MADFAILAIALFSLASLFVGLRLVALARRTGETPELFAATTLLGIGPFGFGLTVASTLLTSHSVLLANLVWGFAAMSLNIGTAAAFLFSYRVFHPGSEAVRKTVGCLLVLLAALWFAEAHFGAFEAATSASFATRISDWLRGAALLVGGAESLRYWTRLRRRIHLGLASPVVARRFLLWGIALFGGGVSNSIDAMMKLFVAEALDYPLLSLTNSLSGLIAAACLTMAFWPNRVARADTPAEPLRAS